MRVLIYEPRYGGHRGVILNYVKKAILRAGYTYQHIESPAEALEPLVPTLRRLAIEQGCSLVHILTGDDHVRSFLRSSWKEDRAAHVMPVIATYYLYSSFTHWAKGPAWDWIFSRRVIDTTLVSDDYLGQRLLAEARRRHLRFLPDPWDSEEFPHYTRHEAIQELGLRDEVVRYLVFGDLGRRKGIDRIIEAFSEFTQPAVELLLVGRWDDSLKNSPTAELLARLETEGRAVLRDGYVAEPQVAKYFHASDYVISAYPRWFSASSGTFTRACAAGRPVIVPEHGVVGELTRSLRLGITFDTESKTSLAKALAASVSPVPPTEYSAMNAAKLAASRGERAFANRLVLAYRSVVGGGAEGQVI